MRVKAYIKRVGLALSVLAIAISNNLVFLAPKSVKADPATNSWVNRAVIRYDNGAAGSDYFIDTDTFDDNMTFVSLHPYDNRCAEPTERSTLVFDKNTSLGDIYYRSNYFGDSPSHFTRTVYEMQTSGQFAGTCVPLVPTIVDVDNTKNRRITFVYDGTNANDSTTITHILNTSGLGGGGATFERWKGSPFAANYLPVFANMSDQDLCRDVIVGRESDPRNENWFTTGNQDGSAMLFSTLTTGGHAAESMHSISDSPNVIGIDTCKKSDENLEGPNSLYKVIDGDDAGGALTGPGFQSCQQNGTTVYHYITHSTLCDGGGDPSDDSYIIFVGTVAANTIPDSALGGGGGGGALCPTDPTILATDPKCGASTTTQPCRVSDTGLANSLSWLICPATELIAKTMNLIETSFIGPLLTVNPLTVGSPTYKLWDVFRNVANVMFAIAFLIIVFSTATGIGVSNLSIKKALPAFIVGVIVANISFFLVAFVVDIFNIMQQGVANLITGLVDQAAVVNNVYTRSATTLEWYGLGAVLLGAIIISGGAILGPIFGLVLLMLAIVVAAAGTLLLRQFAILGYTAILPFSLAIRPIPGLTKIADSVPKGLVKMIAIGPLVVLAFVIGKVLGAIMGSFDPTPNTPGESNLDTFITYGTVMFTYVLPLILLPIIVAQRGTILGAAYGGLRKGFDGARKVAGAGWQSTKGWIADKGSQGGAIRRGIARVATGTVGRGGARRMAMMGAERSERVKKGDEALASYTLNRSGTVPSRRTKEILDGVTKMKLEDVAGLSAKTMRALLSHRDGSVRAAADALFQAAAANPVVAAKLRPEQQAAIAGGIIVPSAAQIAKDEARAATMTTLRTLGKLTGVAKPPKWPKP